MELVRIRVKWFCCYRLGACCRILRFVCLILRGGIRRCSMGMFGIQGKWLVAWGEYLSWILIT